MTKVPKGSTLAAPSPTMRSRSHFSLVKSGTAATQYHTKSMPCAQPTTFTAQGQPAMYFRGIATKSRMRKLTPSATATVRIFAYGRQAIELTQNFEDDQQMWQAVEIVWAQAPLLPPSLTQLGSVDRFVRPF